MFGRLYAILWRNLVARTWYVLCKQLIHPANDCPPLNPDCLGASRGGLMLGNHHTVPRTRKERPEVAFMLGNHHQNHTHDVYYNYVHHASVVPASLA